MNETKESESNTATESSPKENSGDEKILNRIIKRFGGRHLIFRTELGSWQFFRKPYALISPFRGPIWFFYGIGQIWVTHKKYHEFDGWMSRVPRLPAPKIVKLLDMLEEELTSITHYCNESGIEGTIVVEAKVIEFHWTFDYKVDKETEKKDKTDFLDAPFQKLVDKYLEAKATLEV